MTEKQKEVIKAMQGMTYLEWVKLSHVINVRFEAEANAIKNELVIAEPGIIAAKYKQLY